MAASTCLQNFVVSITIGDIEAYVTIHPDDVVKRVRVNTPFTVRAVYNLGRPNILDVPFFVEASEFPGFSIPAGLQILSVMPESPNFSGVSDTEEQDVVVTAIVNEDNPLEIVDEPSPEELHYVYLNISTFQPSPNNAPPLGGTQHTLIDDPVIANLHSLTFGDSVYCSWNLPTENIGGVQHRQPVDYRIRISVPVTDGSGLYHIQGFREYFSRLRENITITLELLRSILEEDNPGEYLTIEEALALGPMRVTFQIKRDEVGAFNQADTSREVRFEFPLRSSPQGNRIPPPRNIEFGLAYYLDDANNLLQRYRLQWEQPYWLGDPDIEGGEFENLWPQSDYHLTNILAQNPLLIDIRSYEYRYRIDGGDWRGWDDATDDILHNLAEFDDDFDASTVVLVREFPFGDTANIDAGIYEFQVRARTFEGVYGRVISVNYTVA